MADPRRYPGAPRWVKVLAMIVVAIFALVVIMRLAGHRPPHGGH
jgi:hypothetical protein